MSSNDIFDVLNVQRSSLEPPKKKKKPEVSKKQLGINRELYNLLGENTPAIQLSSAAKFKQRLTTNKSRPTTWKWAKFKNNARSDGLELSHWVRGRGAALQEQKYAFEQYNQKLKLPKFDEVAYKRLVKKEDDADQENNWSFEETKYLFDICHLYDLRWIIIHDRYNYKPSKESLAEKGTVDAGVPVAPKGKAENSDGKKSDNGPNEKSLEESSSKDGDKDVDKDGEASTKAGENENENEHENKDKTEADGEAQDVSDKEANKKAETEELKNTSAEVKKEEIDNPVQRPHFKKPLSPPSRRSLEDLKERFYSVSQKILADENKILKEAGILDESKNKLIASLSSFNKTKELERKEYLERLLARSPAEIAEEESLVIEARRFEQAAQKMLTERASLLHLLDSPSSTGSINQYLTSQGLSQLYNALMFSDKTKKGNRQDLAPSSAGGNTTITNASGSAVLSNGGSVPPSDALLANAAGAGTKEPKKKKQSEDPVAVLLAKKLTPQEEAAYGLSYHPERLQNGVHLRSSKIASYKPTVQNKVNAVLNELGIPARPVIVTEKVVKKFDALTEAIATLLETKKQIDKMETERRLITKSQ